MKKIIIIAVLAIAAVSSLAAWQTRGRQDGGDDGGRQQVLYDFRKQAQGSPPKLAPATERRILSAVFSSYLKRADDCKEVETPVNDDYLAAARKAGQIVPGVVSMATGSFSAAGQKETAYIISVDECNASHADNYGTKRLAVFSGQKLVADVDTDFKREILRTSDLNGDGIDELLLSGGDMNQGITVGVTALVELHDGKLRVIKDFGKTEENSCESGLSDSNAMASVISYTPAAGGKMPDFHMDNYRAKCLPDSRLARWEFLSSGPMPDE